MHFSKAFVFTVLLSLALFAEPVSVVSPGGPESLVLGQPGGTEPFSRRETVPAVHPAFSEALRVEVLRPTEKVYPIQINQPSAIALAKGDVLRVRLTHRSGAGGGTSLRIPFFVQDRQQGYRSLFNRDVVVGPTWEDSVFTFPVTEDLVAGRIQFCLFLGAARQTLDIGRFEVLNLGNNPGDAALPPDAVRAVSVQGDYLDVRSPKAGITGALPAGWEEDSAWADVAVNYRAQLSNPHSGDRSLRAEVRMVREGNVQFRVPNVIVAPSHILRMRIPLRSEDSRSVTLTLRKRDAPYTPYWQGTLSGSPEWGVYEVIAMVKESDPDASLIFSMNTPGMMEVGDFDIEYLTPEQLLQEQDFSGNLLQTSSFPLGLSAPWACGANGTTPEHLHADPDMPGPSGLPSLRMVPHRFEGRPMMQISSPFTGKPGAVHTFSFWAKSERPGMNVSMRMGPPSAQLWTGDWNKSISLGTEWTRHEFSVLLPPAPDMLYLARITSHDMGVFWVDQVMVEVAESAGPFQSAGPVELHAVAARGFGLSFEDESLPYRLALDGDLSKAARITGTVLDLYGREVELPAIPVTRVGTSGGLILDAELPPQAQLGSFLLTHQVVDAQGLPIGKPSELLLHRVRHPRHWERPAFDSPFGTHVNSTPAGIRMAKALGFNWNRNHYGFNWNALQREDGTWDFGRADENVTLHAENNLLILTHLGGVPRKYSVVNQNWDGANSWYRTTAAPRMDAMDAFEQYAYELLSHAGASLQAVEVWNEPFLPGFFVGDVQNGRPVRERPEVLIEMKRRARSAATRAGYKGKLVWNIGPHYGESEKGFDSAVRDLGGAELVDGLTFHRYTNANLAFPGDRFAEDLRIIHEVFAGKDALAHVWNSEGGHGLSELFNLYRRVPPNLRSRADMQAAQYVRYFLSNLAAGAEKVFIYTYYLQDGWVSSYGYMNVDGTLSQIAPATSNMAWQLEDKTFAAQEALDETVYAQLYTGKTENTVVLLPSGRGPARLHHQPASLRVADLYGNPVQTPHTLGGGILYLSAPGLTLAQAAELLAEAAPRSFPTPSPVSEPSPLPQPGQQTSLRLIALLAGGVVLLLLFISSASRQKRG